MPKISCFSALLGGKRRTSKVRSKKVNGNDCPKVKPVELMDMAETVDVTAGGGDVASPACDTKVVVHEAADLCSCGRGEDDDKPSIMRGLSDANLVGGEVSISSGYNTDDVGKQGDKTAEPWSSTGRVPPAASPMLKRSCSNIETERSAPFDFDAPAKSRSYGDLKALPPGWATTPSGAPDASPTGSVKTSFSADRVMLKKRSSAQVLPSRSRKLWWRLFLWSHRNLHRPAGPALPSAGPGTDGAPRQRDGGYTSDTLDAATVVTAGGKNKEVATEDAPIPDQWVAFSAEASSLDRVSAWVNSLGSDSFRFHAVDGEERVAERGADGAGPSRYLEIEELPAAGKRPAQEKRRAADEVGKANTIVQTLNTVSTVAHISGMGIKAVPAMAAFSSLRTVNLSANFIVHVSPGSLPKGLHSLDLSRNSIASIEGLRDLTRLRVLNLSYNRIARIGHGLSGCAAIRELYLAGNKISEVEGLHRLLKLAVLDVSFNRITTAKSLGQLAANYSSLRALNLLGNPVQANVGDDTLRKAASGLLPRLEYLNRQPVKPQRAGEVAKDSVAQAALGNAAGWSSRRRWPRRAGHGDAGSSARGRGREGSGSGSYRGSRSRSMNRLQSSSLAIARR